MIARVEGALFEKKPTRIVVDVQGVGYELWIPLSTYSALPDAGKTVALHVHTHAREGALQLFGFASGAERSAFELLLRASRVGPKLAQTVLSGISPHSLVSAIRSNDVALLCKVPGIGRKLAERMIVELRDRVGEFVPGESEVGTGSASAIGANEEALSALLNLGYPRAQAERVIEVAAKEVGEGASTESLIRAALKGLAA